MSIFDLDVRTPVSSDESAFVWPPRPDARFDPVVFDTKTNAMMSVGEATAAFGLVDKAVDQVLERSTDRDDDMLSLFRPESHSRTSESHSRAADRRRPIGIDSPPASRSHRPSARVVVGCALLLFTLSIAVVVARRSGTIARLVVATQSMLSARAGEPSNTAEVSSNTAEVARENAAVSLRSTTGTAGTIVARGDIVLPAAGPTGALTIRSAPAGADVMVDDELRGTTPVTLHDLSAGAHRIRIERGGITAERTVRITPSRTVSVWVPMFDSGWMIVQLPFEADVFERDRPLGKTSDGRLALSPGPHTFRFVNQSLGFDSSVSASIARGTTTRVQPPIPQGALRINAIPWANVWVDDMPVGETPLGDVRVPIGPHEVRFVHPELGEQRVQVVVSAGEPARLSVNLR